MREGLPERAQDSGVIDSGYRYDKNGNVAAITDDTAGELSLRYMTYDAMDRLRRSSAPNDWGDANYTYDALDNLTTAEITDGATARRTVHAFDPATNRLTGISNGPPGYNFAYGYDSQGNITSRGSQRYVFDQGNRMTRAAGKATYAYDGLGHRVSTVGTDGVNRVQVYSQEGQLLYAGPTGSTGTKYVYLHNHVIAEVGSSGTTYDHTDALGSPVGQSNASGQVINRTRYEPYGYAVAGTSKTIGFTGHVNDNDTGLVYMQQRYYDPIAGRMLSIDPVTTDANTGSSFNRYVYANNNPYRYFDPDGRDSEEKPKPIDKREEQLRKQEERARKDCQGNCQFYSATGRSGSYNPGDVRGGFDAHGNSLVYSPGNYDPNHAAAVLIGVVSAVGVPEAALFKLTSEFRLVFRTSHYASRLEEAGLSVARTERLVGREVRSFAKELAPNSDVVGRIRLRGVFVEYRARLLPGDVINVGTIFSVK